MKDNIIIKIKDYECNKCTFYNEQIKKCIDRELFVDKRNTLLIVCRYNINAININKVKK